MAAEICPLCRGQGVEVRRFPGDGMPSTMALSPTKVVCHACNGKGIIWPPTDVPGPSDNEFGPGAEPLSVELGRSAWRRMADESDDG